MRAWRSEVGSDDRNMVDRKMKSGAIRNWCVRHPKDGFLPPFCPHPAFVLPSPCPHSACVLPASCPAERAETPKKGRKTGKTSRVQTAKKNIDHTLHQRPSPRPAPGRRGEQLAFIDPCERAAECPASAPVSVGERRGARKQALTPNSTSGRGESKGGQTGPNGDAAATNSAKRERNHDPAQKRAICRRRRKLDGNRAKPCHFVPHMQSRRGNLGVAATVAKCQVAPNAAKTATKQCQTCQTWHWG